MRLLHARNAAHGGGPVEVGRGAEPRRDPRTHFRKLLPLHRLPRDRRRGGSSRAGTRGSVVMRITEDNPPILTALDRPNSYIGRSVLRPNLKSLAEGGGT